MKQNYLLFFLILCCTFELFAQKQASYWYFGNNAGLDFSSGAPVAILDGALRTSEGCASISDVNGNLLFYTDGSRVWNKDHLVMPHGNSLFGHSSSTQSAIIVPKPDDPELYFIFTVDWANGDHGLNYYTVDMRLDGGLGDVLGQGGTPDPTLLTSAPVNEKITAVKVEGEAAFWVIGNKGNRFLVYKVDASGVHTTPVPGNANFVSSSDSRGYLKVSPDGTKLVAAAMSSGSYLYDFDPLTGVVSNQRGLDLNGEHGYGVEFSPLSKKLYISTGDYADFGSSSLEILYQFNLADGMLTEAQVNDSRVELHRYQNQRGALQLALDGKIYRAINNTSFLGVINNPDVDGLGANYIHNAISLNGKSSTQGLPPFIQSFLAAFVNVEDNCFGQETQFSIDSNEPIVSISWDFGDGSPLDTRLNPSHLYASVGVYELTVTVVTADQTKEIIQQIEILEVPEIETTVTLFQCDDNLDGQTSFNLYQAESLISEEASMLSFSFYETFAAASQGDVFQQISSPSAYEQTSGAIVYARVENQAGCERIAEISLQVTTTSLAEHTQVVAHQCDDDTDGDAQNGYVRFDLTLAIEELKGLFSGEQNLDIQLYETMTDGLAETNPITIYAYTNTVQYNQDLVVRIENRDNNACLGLGYYLRLAVDDIPEYELDSFAYLCLNTPNEPVLINVRNAQGDYRYEWKNSSGEIIGVEASHEFFHEGVYSVTAFNTYGCGITKSVEIRSSDLAQIEEISVDDDQEINTISLRVSGPGNYEFALDNGPFQDEPFFDNVPSGVVQLRIRDKLGCGEITQEIAVFGFPKFFTPNGDGFNDTWQIDGVSFQPASQIFIYDRFGKLIVQLDPSSPGWDGRYRGKQMPDGDYWFNVKLEDGRLFKGHFSLLRK